jgi:hypothetical protein
LLLVFKPNCLVTRKHLAAVCPEDNPAYGALYLTLTQLRNSVRQSDTPEVPQWPQADCIFTAPAFEVAAVLFRDEVERFITWIYQHALERSNPSSPAHSEELTVQAQPSLLKDLEEATLQMPGEVTMVIPTGKRKSVSPVQAKSVPLPSSRTSSNQLSIRDSPIPLSPKVLTPPSARSLELPTIKVSPHNLGQLEEELPPPQDRTTVSLLRQVADSRAPHSSPESTIQRPVGPNLDIPDTPFRPLSAAEGFSPPSASTPRVISRPLTPYRYNSTSNSLGSQSMSIDEPTEVRRTEPVEPEEIMDSSQELAIRPLLLTPPAVQPPEHPSGYTIHDMGPFQAWLPNSVQPDGDHEDIAQPANNSERLGSPDSIRMEERPELYITNPASPAESLSSISSVSTQSTRVTQVPLLQSTPRHVTISEEFSPTTRQPVWPNRGNSLRDIPPHAEFVTRRTSAGTRRSSGQPMVPAEEFTRISTIPEEPEDLHPPAPSNVQPSYVAHPCSTRTISINETPMRPPSVCTPELPESLGMSRRGIPVTQIMSQVPLKKTVPDRHIDRNTLPKHMQGRMIASR